MEESETKTIEEELEEQRVRQEEIRGQIDVLEKQLQTLFVERPLAKVFRDYLSEQERFVNWLIKFQHKTLLELRAQSKDCYLAIKALGARLKKGEAQ